MSPRAWLVVCGAAPLLFVAGGCAEERCAPAATIVPGVGTDLAGAPVCLGANRAQTARLLGDGGERDLGVAGKLVLYPDRHASLLFAESGALAAINLEPGVSARTASGVGIGSDQADARAALGEPVVDPLLGAWWYPAQGIVLQWKDGKAAAIQIAPPRGYR
jgi:hypothetical protein